MQPYYKTQKWDLMPAQQDSRVNKIMWYVDAHKGGVTIHLPCWGVSQAPEHEAKQIVETLTRAGWTGPVKAIDSKTERPKYHTTPKISSKSIEPKHPHWREFLEDA
jgi:hypothetical protein